ncbi:MAG: hypothetical protein MK185_01690 [Saccharospirillaceae bacterium]|nr:hypothetical protein A3759_17655 [Thalassolituus sp. HI0120]MCH2039333.1 hypothetical protein [Saccharospirillaceae bacterium]
MLLISSDLAEQALSSTLFAALNKDSLDDPLVNVFSIESLPAILRCRNENFDDYSIGVITDFLNEENQVEKSKLANFIMSCSGGFVVLDFSVFERFYFGQALEVIRKEMLYSKRDLDFVFIVPDFELSFISSLLVDRVYYTPTGIDISDLSHKVKWFYRRSKITRFAYGISSLSDLFSRKRRLK